MPRIELRNIRFGYPLDKNEEYLVFDHFSHLFDDGKIHVIVGPSGSGKTTILKLVLGTEDPEEGEILFDKAIMTRLDPFKRKTAYVSQSIALYPHYSIFNNIAFPLSVAKAPVDEIRVRVRQIARELGIEHCLTRKPKQLSLGQNQRAAIARCLLKDADAYLFDEPLSNLDPETRAKVLPLIRKRLKERKATAIYVTHDPKDAQRIADVIHILEDGKFVRVGTKEELLASGDEYARDLLGL